MTLDKIIERWTAHSRATGTTAEDRLQAIRGYKVYYETHDIPWIGDDNVHFYDSPMAAVQACAKAFLEDEEKRSFSDAEVEAKANELWYDHMGGRMWPTWPAYIEYAKDKMGDELPDKFLAIIDQAQCSYWWPSDTGIWASDNPTVLLADEEDNLHNEGGPAMAWSDGWHINMVHGVLMNDHKAGLLDHETITVQQIKAESNLEVKRVLRELYGDAKYLNDIGAKVLDMDQVPTMSGKKDQPWIHRALMEDDEGDRWLMAGDGSTEDVYCIPVTSDAATCVAAYDMLRAHPPTANNKKIKTIMEC